MCTLILHHAPGAPWPLLLAANRDELLARPWDAPAAHWPGIIGGRDSLAGGTWLAINAHGVVAGVLNRTGALGPEAGKRSRGELPLLALAHASAADAAATLAGLDAGQWRGFNLVVADRTHGFVLRGLGHGKVEAIALAPGLTMITAADANDRGHPRIRRHLPRFELADLPTPPDLRPWETLLADRDGAWEEQLNVQPLQGFGTVSAALIGVGARPGEHCFHFAPGSPERTSFAPVPLSFA